MKKFYLKDKLIKQSHIEPSSILQQIASLVCIRRRSEWVTTASETYQAASDICINVTIR